MSEIDDLKVLAIVMLTLFIIGIIIGIAIGYYDWASFLNWFYAGLSEVGHIAEIVAIATLIALFLYFIVNRYPQKKE